ncbi:MAG: M15 family metallopeptidase [Thermodesulfobacteriota bacterium]
MRRGVPVALILAVVSTLVCPAWTGADSPARPDDFAYVDHIIPDIQVELRYCTGNNFVGRPIDGYLKPRCILTRRAAEALKRVQDELRPYGLGLKIYDAYRPQRAVDHFVRWAQDPDDAKTKHTYYPRMKKDDLFRDGYIAKRSGHSRGSTVDLALVSLSQQGSEAEIDSQQGSEAEIDMGTPFDFFGPESWSASSAVSAPQRAHRLLLRALMEKHGFKPYLKEWWHFTLTDEPYPNTYFDFPVE